MEAALRDANSERSSLEGIRNRIRQVIKDHARLSISVDTLIDSADLGIAGMTSHANVMVMLALENEFGLEFPDNMLSRSIFQSVDSIGVAIKSLQDVE
jgi:acyl carrier protein